MNVKTGVLGPVDVWKSKDEFIEKERKSQEEWEKMADDDRQAIFEIVGRALDRLKDNIETWVPASLEVQSGRYLDCTFRILFSELEEEIKAREELTQRRIQAAAEETVAMVEELTSRDQT